MTTLLLIRHGESEANRQKIFTGQINPDLEPEGLLQAEMTAKYIAENYKVDKIYASDLNRAYKTGLALGELLEMEVIPDKNLREINGGEWEGKHFCDLPKLYARDFYMWMSDIGRSRPTNGESVRELGDRIMAELTKIAEENDGKTVAIATHATPIRAAQSILQTGSVDKMTNIPFVSNASVTVLEYDGSWNLVKIGIDEHLGKLKTALPANV